MRISAGPANMRITGVDSTCAWAKTRHNKRPEPRMMLAAVAATVVNVRWIGLPYKLQYSAIEVQSFDWAVVRGEG